MDEYRDIENEFDKLERSLVKRKWKCMCPNCNEHAINSHLLQRNGILNHVAENGHLYEMRGQYVYNLRYTNVLMEPQKVGINHAISFPLFCGKHDSSLFKSIEGNHIDFDDYRTQLLFSYRSICSEIRKKQFNIERFRLLTENQDKFDVLLGTKLGICDLNTYKQLVEENLNESDHKFTFLHLTYPFLPVYASGVTSNYFIDEENNSYMEHIAIEPMLDSIFINIIPQHESLEIIIGYSNDHIHKNLLNYIKSWENLSWEKLQQQIWNLFEHSIETWGISPSFYDKMPQVWKYGYTSLNFNT